MSLNTNSWDYGYHISLKKVNIDILQNATRDKEFVNKFLTDTNNISISASNSLTELNTNVLSAIKKYDQAIRNIELYKDLKPNFLSSLVAPSFNSSVLDYLLNWLEEVLKEIYKDQNRKKREVLVLSNKKINNKSSQNFTDDDEIKIIKNRAKIYLEYTYYNRLYDLTVPITLYNTIKERNVDYLHSGALVPTPLDTTNGITDVLKGLFQTLLSALIPVKYIDKAVFFTNSSLASPQLNSVIMIEGLSNWQFLIGGGGSVGKIKYDTTFQIIEIDEFGVGAIKTNEVNDSANKPINNRKISFESNINFNWLSNASKVENNIAKESLSAPVIKPNLESSTYSIYLANSITHYINKLYTTYYILDDINMNIATDKNFATTDNYHRYNHAFSHFNIAAYEALDKSDLSWMFPTTTTYAIQDESTVPPDLNNSVLSICCMINGNPNKNPATANLNAIPAGANSALVIERSIFAEYMVLPKIGKDIIPQIANSEKMEFDKLSSYSFINNLDAKLKYGDFKTSFSYFGLLPIVDWLSWKIGYPVYHGTVFSKMANITINQDNINLRLKDVKYMYSLENFPKITQEYITTLKYENGELKASVQLVDAAINYFHTDFTAQILLSGISSLSYFSKDSNTKLSLWNYFLFSSKYVINELKKVETLLNDEIIKNKKKESNIQEDNNNEDLNKSNIILEQSKNLISFEVSKLEDNKEPKKSTLKNVRNNLRKILPSNARKIIENSEESKELIKRRKMLTIRQNGEIKHVNNSLFSNEFNKNRLKEEMERVIREYPKKN